MLQQAAGDRAAKAGLAVDGNRTLAVDSFQHGGELGQWFEYGLRDVHLLPFAGLADVDNLHVLEFAVEILYGDLRDLLNRQALAEQRRHAVF